MSGLAALLGGGLDPRLAAMLGKIALIAGTDDDATREAKYDEVASMLAAVKADARDGSAGGTEEGGTESGTGEGGEETKAKSVPGDESRTEDSSARAEKGSSRAAAVRC